MTITIIAPTRIEVDGIDAGTVMTYARAHPEQQAEIDQAFINWHAGHVTATQRADSDRDAAIAKAKADSDAEVEKHKAIAADAISARDSAQSAVAAAFKALSEHPVIAGNDKARKLREAQAQADAAAAALKALQA